MSGKAGQDWETDPPYYVGLDEQELLELLEELEPQRQAQLREAHSNDSDRSQHSDPTRCADRGA